MPLSAEPSTGASFEGDAAAVDGVTAGNYVIRDVLVCPDGTLRIVPK